MSEREYITRWTAHKAQRLHQHRIPVWQEEPANRSPWILAAQGNAIHWVRPHYLWDKDHRAKGDETRDALVHIWRSPGQGALPPKGIEHCIWPKITYDIQQLIEKCMICQEYGKSQLLIGTTQELPSFPWHTLMTDLFYWKRMDFLIVADVFSKYILVRKFSNSTFAAVCIVL